jgi:hypothetical protein
METTNQQPQQQVAVQQAEQIDNSMQVFGSKNNFETAMRMARCLSASTLVPQQYQGERGMPNCLIALEMANRIGASPFMVMQNMYIVHGNPAWSSKFLIACVNMSGKFATPIQYEWTGEAGTDEWGCRAYATDKAGNIVKGSKVTIAMAKVEGWYNKNGSKWQTMPELMLQYRAGAFFQRAYAPELSMGLMTADEVRDIEEQPKQNPPQVTIPADQASKATDMLKGAFDAEIIEENQPKDTLFE